MDYASMLFGLAVACPLKEEHKNCPLKEIRKLDNLKDRLKYIDSLNPLEQYKLYSIHKSHVLELKTLQIK